MAVPFEVEDDLDLDGEVSSEFDGLFHEDEFIALGLNPSSPTHAKPGSEDKVQMLAARYAAGLPLWHDRDCYDHGPSEMVEIHDEEEEEVDVLD